MPIIKEDPLRVSDRYSPQQYNFNSVKTEVSEAVTFDWKRDKVDDAKKRAIYDARSYDEFKDRVAGCTLKPIHRSEFNAPPKQHTYNGRDAEKSKGPSTGIGPQDDSNPQVICARGYSASCENGVVTEKVPRNGHEFEREFRRRATAEDKVRLLELVLAKDLVARLFSRELDGEMFRQILTALEDVLDRGSASPGIARRCLLALAVECPVAITSACSFFDAEERRTLARLLARDPASKKEEDVRVCAAFGIPMSSIAEAAAKLPPATVAPAAAEEAPAAQGAESGGMD